MRVELLPGSKNYKFLVKALFILAQEMFFLKVVFLLRVRLQLMDKSNQFQVIFVILIFGFRWVAYKASVMITFQM